mmetsp:Transcript_31176/g.99019  ORF Transcript_31176/g.99019 Transcript_31176/m.99019 type:complete len:222 (-) Transcript_31176:46-711(-)
MTSWTPRTTHSGARSMLSGTVSLASISRDPAVGSILRRRRQVDPEMASEYSSAYGLNPALWFRKDDVLDPQLHQEAMEKFETMNEAWLTVGTPVHMPVLTPEMAKLLASAHGLAENVDRVFAEAVRADWRRSGRRSRGEEKKGEEVCSYWEFCDALRRLDYPGIVSVPEPAEQQRQKRLKQRMETMRESKDFDMNEDTPRQDEIPRSDNVWRRCASRRTST